MKPLFLLVVLLLGIPAWAQKPVTVRVLDEANAPIVGALIETQVWLDEHDPIAPVVTGTDGTATISLPLNDEGKNTPGSISVAAKGFAFKSASIAKETVEIRLEKGATWRGKVLNDAGKPLPDAKVRLTGAQLDGDWQRSIRPSGEKTIALYTTKSGTDGTFQIEDVPAKWDLLYEVEHPNYVIKSGRNGKANLEEVVKLVPGGALRGRVLDIEGKPLRKVPLYASLNPRGGGGNDGLTDENGNFTIASLAAGQYDVGAYLSLKASVLPRQSGVRVEVGKTTDIAELRAIKGVEIRGIVRDAATKKPLAGAGALAEQDNETSAYKNSDKEGRFSLHVAPGTYQVYLSGTPKGYLRPAAQQNVNATGEVPVELTFDLQKAIKITGVTVDEKEKPIAAKINFGWEEGIESDAAGKWEYTPSQKGPLRVGGGEDEDGYFEIVGTDKIEAPERGNNIIKVRKKPWATLAGRVVGSDGSPLEGVKVSATFYVPMGDGMSTSATRQATSDADGRFVLPRIRESRNIKVEGKKEGFAFQEGGKVAKEGINWTASNLVFVPLNRRIEGTTAPGSRVVAAGRETTADQNGKFVFEGLPQGEITVFAAQEGFGSGVVRAAEPITIALQKQEAQGIDAALAEEIRAETRRDAVGKDFYAESALNRPDGSSNFEAALKVALAKPAGERDDHISRVTTQWKTGDSLELLQNALDEIGHADKRTYAYLDAALKTGDPDIARNALQTAEQTFKSPEKENWWRETSLYRAATVAERVEGEKAGFTALDRAIAYTIKNHGEKSVVKDGYQTQVGRDDLMSGQAETIAAGSLPLLRRLLGNIDPDTGYATKALAEAIPVVAKTHGVEVALPLLEELAKRPVVPQDGDFNYAVFDPQYAFGQAASKLIPFLAAKSPETALQLARRIQKKEHRARALASAAPFQPDDVKASLWREVIQGANTEDAPRFAARAWNTDPKLGLELFEIVRTKVAAEMGQPYSYRNLWAPLAFYLAPVDPAGARLILEREWVLGKQKKADGQDLQALARAMSAIDGRRAWEMARQLEGNKDFWSLETRRKIAQYLTTSQENRRDFPFDRWGATDTWEPGGEEW